MPLICLMLALSTGVAGFELLNARTQSSDRDVRISPSRRPAQLLVQAMHRADRAAKSNVAAARRLVAPRLANAGAAPAAQLPELAPKPELAQMEAFAAARAISAPPDPPVRARAQELRVAAPALGVGARVEVTLSFYYCEEVPSEFGSGDGGGFCGLMRDGSRVYPGAAACASEYLGQQFRILGDPTARVYRCADTGSLIDVGHRDIWFQTNDAGWRWQRAVGPSATIEILP